MILGIDPGIREVNPAGWALLDDEAIVACGVIPPPAGRLPWERRVEFLGRAVAQLAALHRPEALACEAAYLGDNPKTYAQLLACGWELRVQARLIGVPFALVNPRDQHDLLHGRRAIPAPLLVAATAHLPAATAKHAMSAIAIAWHGRGLLAAQALAARAG